MITPTVSLPRKKSFPVPRVPERFQIPGSTGQPPSRIAACEPAEREMSSRDIHGDKKGNVRKGAGQVAFSKSALVFALLQTPFFMLGCNMPIYEYACEK